MAIDVDKDLIHIHRLIVEAIKPALDQFTDLLNALSMEITDSDYLMEQGIEGVMDNVLWGWAKELNDPIAGNYPTMAARAILKTAFNDNPPATFWRSELGQIILSVDGFPMRSATKTEVAAVLGVTHPAVTQLIGTWLKLDAKNKDRITRKSMLNYRQLRLQRAAALEEARSTDG